MPTLPTKLTAYLESLTLAGGDHDGEPFVALPWERRFIRGAFGRSGHAALSVGRANGKTALVAGLAAAVVDPAGPLHGRRREVVAVASSFDQGKHVFEDVLAFLRERYDLSDRKTWRIQDSANRAMVEYRATGARCRTIGSDPAKAHGLRPALALLDEPAQWPSSTRDKMHAAIRTGLGKVPGSKMIALGTRPVGTEHFFGKMLAGVGVRYAQCHAADKKDPPFRVRTWRKANPSFDHLPSLQIEIRDEAALAKADPELLHSFRALRLNQGVSEVAESELVASGTWERITGDAAPEGPCAWGFDLGQSFAMAAVACWWLQTGRLQALASFPSQPTLAERGLSDGVGNLYVRMAERGELVVTGGEAVDIAELVKIAYRRFGAPSCIAADTHREKELVDILRKSGIPVVRYEKRGLGYIDGGDDVRRFRRAIAEGKVAPAPSLLLSAAASEARTIADPAGNHKLAKKTEGGRRQRAKDDAIAAAILAVGIGTRNEKRLLGGGGGGGAYLGML